jgi:tetratricopeptide (TPR) repeat protein
MLAALLLLPALCLGEAMPTTQTVLVFPFSNAARQPRVEWMSEAFPEALSQRLNTASLYVISREDRQYAFDRMGIPINLHASRATLYRIATQLDADFILLGSYSSDGQTLTARAQVLDMKALRLLPDQVESGPLSQFMTIQAALAWDLLRQIRPKFAETRQQFLQRAPDVRLDAFENFIRGGMAATSADKVRYLEAALAIDPSYSQATLLLGKTYFTARDYERAAASLAKFAPDDPAFAQASFYLGLSEFHLGHFERASAAFKATAERVPLTEVLNNIGAAESRRGRRGAADYFQKAVKADPSDPDYHFNLAVALFRSGDAPGAQRQLGETLRLRPSDAEARQFADAILANPSPAVPFSRIKQNYDESSYRQLSLELQNAIDESIRKAKPAAQASLRLERARELLANGAAGQAESQFRASLTLDPGNPDALAGLAHALLLENNFAEARKQAQAAIAVEPSSEAYLVLARAALHDRDRAAAGQNLQKALSFGPPDEDSKAVAQEIQNQAAEEAQERR